MKKLINYLILLSLSMFFLGCGGPNNNDPELVGKWSRERYKTIYDIEFYSNGIGSDDFENIVTDDIKYKGRNRINWVTFNNNFLLINGDGELIGLSYQIIGDTLITRETDQHVGDSKYWIKVKN